MTIENQARKIMMKMKGYRAKDMVDDLQEFPYAHQNELKWLIRELKKMRNVKEPKCYKKKLCRK